MWKYNCQQHSSPQQIFSCCGLFCCSQVNRHHSTRTFVGRSLNISFFLFRCSWISNMLISLTTIYWLTFNNCWSQIFTTIIKITHDSRPLIFSMFCRAAFYSFLPETLSIFRTIRRRFLFSIPTSYSRYRHWSINYDKV